MLGEYQTLLLICSPQAQVSDRWQWQPDPDKCYSVRDAYQLMTSQYSVTMDAAEDLIWHSQVPLKVSIFVWHLLRDRLPTKANLVSRDILSPEARHCVSGCGEVESAQHLFLSCGTFGSFWPLVRSWIGFFRWTLILFQTILFSLPIQRVVLVHADLFCSSSSLHAFGLCRVREIIDCSEAQQIPYINFWTRSRLFPTGDCKRQMLL
jgi:hypothetical protein